MTYTPQVWVNNGPPAIDADHLNYMEAGIQDAAALHAGDVKVARKIAGTWQARPTTRTDVTVFWIGPDPDPPVVTSGTGGMYAGDERHVTP